MRAWAIASSRLLAVVLGLATALAGAAHVHAQPAGQSEDESGAFVEEGRAAVKKGDYAKAARALDEALRLNPRRLEAYVLRTAVHSAKKEHAAGVALMRRAQALAPDDIDVLTALGTQLVLAGEGAEGAPILAGVVARAPRRYDAHVVLGDHYHATGAYAKAVIALEAYLASRPDELAGEDPDHQIDLADSYLRARKPAKALALFTAAEKAKGGDLRARVGVAWATAATDCRKARPLLAELRDVSEQYPEIFLVDGRCALALGDTAAARDLGKRYLAVRPDGAPAAHALVGEAEAARGDLAAARTELALARDLEPDRRRWAVKLGAVLRKGGDPVAALGELDAIGPPADPSEDPEWWAEVGDALLARGEVADVVTRLGPVAPGLTGHAGASTVYGEALARTGAIDAAVAPLEAAEAAGSTARSRQWLGYALAQLGTKALADGDLPTAEARLARAVAVAPTPPAWRNLGIVRLAAGGDAVGALEKATADGTAESWSLLGRALATSDPARAREAYGKALAVAADATLLSIAADAAAFELAYGDPPNAVADLERASAAAKSIKQRGLAARHAYALATARHAAGLAALRAGHGAKAVEQLATATGGLDDHAVRCDLAIATVIAGDREPAIKRLKAVAGKACPFPPPADTQAVPILLAFVEGRQKGKSAKALARLRAIDAKTSGPIDALVGIAIRVVALEAADDAYRGGKLAQAKKLLAEAKAAQTKAAADELGHNTAVVDIADGKLDEAIAALEKNKLPEALVNLGIAYDKKGEGQKALDAWRRARKAGVRFAPLADWIAAKEQIYGEGDR
jgi:tetratricopeptide (TPR) repeat protein